MRNELPKGMEKSEKWIDLTLESQRSFNGASSGKFCVLNLFLTLIDTRIIMLQVILL